MSRRGSAARAVVALLALAVVGAAASGCAGDPAPDRPGAARIDVDTPELRAARRDAGIEPCRPGDGVPVAEGLPDVTLPCLGGGPDVSLSSLRGPLVVNLWAAWCGPCRRELPLYQRFYEAHGDRVPVLGIDFNDPQPGGALELAADSGVTYPLLADPQAVLAGPRPGLVPRGLPMLVLVDADGTVVLLQAMEVRSVAQLEDLVRDRLGVAL